MTSYLLELVLVHSLLFLGYRLFLSSETQYGYLRLYLLSTVLLALVVPLISLPPIWAYPSPALSTTPALIPTYFLDPMSVNGEAPASFWWSWNSLWWVYGLVTIWFLYQIAYALIQVARLIRQSSPESIEGTTIRRVDYIQGSFTFFGWIFIHRGIQKDDPGFLPILRHESAHASLAHSLDILLLLLFRAFFWWLPTAWFALREMRKIHEYHADAHVLKTCGADQYAEILIRNTLKSNGISLASSFHEGFTLQRLKALKKGITHIKPWKMRTLITLIVVLLAVFACSGELGQDIKKMGESNNLITFEQLPEDMQRSLADQKDLLLFTRVSLPENDGQAGQDAIANAEALQDIDPELIYALSVNKDTRELFVAIKKDGANFDLLSEKSKSEGEVFTIVEDQPMYPGGMEAFYEYIGRNLKYPAEARTSGTEGRVYVQFIVDKDGTLTEVTTVKGIGGGCDEEAVRVVREAPKFTPGMNKGEPVKVRMVLPVIFQLGPQRPEQGKAK